MKYVVAVSGGVDSVVLLDILMKRNENELVVAHFDHGIRGDSAADSRFVGGLAEKYGLMFETKREELGASASEELARSRRYQFLRDVVKKNGGVIVTAHHADDVIETIAINIRRGTGWRGLAVLNSPDVERPLIDMTKSDIYKYAVANQLEWVEDETNASSKYLRNRLRKKLPTLPETSRHELLRVRNEQVRRAAEIDSESDSLASTSRHFYTMIDKASADELLRRVLLAYDVALTRPQRERLLHAIHTYKPGQTFQAGSKSRIEFTTRDFVVK